MRKFIILYLNTGNGHLNTAKVLSKELRKNSNVEVVLKHGFSPKSFLLREIFERGYNLSLNVFKGSFALLYVVGQHRFFQAIVNYIVGIKTTKYVCSLIKTENPTDIIVVHYGLVDATMRAINATNKNINCTVIVTDPFTAPHAWFYNRCAKYFVMSEEAKKIAMENCKVPGNNITVIPFIVNDKYTAMRNSILSAEEKRLLKKQLNLDENKKIVLLVGGGEGLPHAKRIISYCVMHKADFSIVVICGRNKVLQRTLSIFQSVLPNLYVLGFIDYLEKLVQVADCIVAKAGPAMVLESLCAKKPLVICAYLYNHEVGNMRFAVYNDVAYFVRSPKNIYKKIENILTDENYAKVIQKNFAKLKIDTDISKVAKLLLERNESEPVA